MRISIHCHCKVELIVSRYSYCFGGNFVDNCLAQGKYLGTSGKNSMNVLHAVQKVDFVELHYSNCSTDYLQTTSTS